MIGIMGTLTMTAEAMKTYTADMNAMVEEVRAEDGCVFYSVLVENHEAGLVSISEIWRDEAAWAVHFQQPWTTAFFEKYGPQMIGSTLQMYDMSNQRDLPS